MRTNLKRKRVDSCVHKDYKPEIPGCIQGNVAVDFSSLNPACWDQSVESKCTAIAFEYFSNTYSRRVAEFVSENANVPHRNHTPLRVGVITLDEQSPGEDNVVWGLLDAIKAHHSGSRLFRFSQGILHIGRILEVTHQSLESYKNQSLRLLERTVNRGLRHVSCTDIETLDGFVVIGGYASSGNAHDMAESIAKEKCQTKVVISVPVARNGDYKNPFIETSVGFDTVCKVISQTISDICNDALSEGKCYHFVKLEAGGKTSHVVLECALQSHPNMVFLSVEVAKNRLELSDIINEICDAVQARAEKGLYHGVILVPEDLMGSIKDVKSLVELTRVRDFESIPAEVRGELSQLFTSFPSSIREQLTHQHESHSRLDASKLDVGIILPHLVKAELNKRSSEGIYKGDFKSICTPLGRQAYKSSPSKFDCDYAYVLGHACYHTIVNGLSGYAATVRNLKNPVSQWRCGAAPIMACSGDVVEVVKADEDAPKLILRIGPTEVDLKGGPYKLWEEMKNKCKITDDYKNPEADEKTKTLCAEDRATHVDRIKQFMRENEINWPNWAGFCIFHLDNEMTDHLAVLTSPRC